MSAGARATRATILLLLGALVLIGLNLKVRLSTQHPRFNLDDETGYFKTESAIQYRYARLAARGEPLPEIDRAAQYPEGIQTRRELTFWMERLVGASYRWVASPTTDFRWFCLVWVGLISSLAIPAFYFCALRLTRSQGLALAGAAAYGLSWAAQANVVASFRLETLGLPLMFASLACCAALLDPEEGTPHLWGAAAAGFLFAAFGTWHLSRFYLATYFLAGAWAWRRNPGNARLKLALVYPAAAAVAALLFIPSARAGFFIASPASYGHVYGLVFEKLRHGLRHPADPAALSPVMRVEWTGPSNSPELGFALFVFLPLALIAFPRLWRRREKSEPSAFGDIADALFIIYLAGTVLSSRLAPWLAYFFGLFALRLPAARRNSKAVIALFALVGILEGFKTLAPASPLNPFMRLSAPFTRSQAKPGFSFSSERDLLIWLRQNAGVSRPTLASMGLSASILTYADTPILLQPKFEASLIREKTAEFARALFESEDEFSRYCDRYGAKLFVYGADAVLDETFEGLRYASGKLALRAQSAAFQFHFSPQTLKKFRLVFQNEGYRVFERVPPSGSGKPPPEPLYELARYAPESMPDGTVKLDVAGVLNRLDTARLKLLLARIYSQIGRREQAISLYEESFAAWPPDDKARAEYERLRAH